MDRGAEVAAVDDADCHALYAIRHGRTGIRSARLAAGAADLALFESTIAEMRVFRVPEFLGMAVLLGLLAVVFLFVSQGFV